MNGSAVGDGIFFALKPNLVGEVENGGETKYIYICLLGEGIVCEICVTNLCPRGKKEREKKANAD